MKSIRIIQFIVYVVVTVLLTILVIAIIPDAFDRFFWGNSMSILFLLFLTGTLALVLISLRLNFTILRMNGALTFTPGIRLPKGNLSSVLLLSTALLIIFAVANMPRFYVSTDCFGSIEMSLPAWMFLLDPKRAQWGSGSYTFDLPQILVFSFYSIGFSLYIFLRNAGLIRTMAVPVSMSIRSWPVYGQMLLGGLFIMFSVFLLIELKSDIHGLISAKHLDENVIISFAIFGFIISFIQISLIFLFGVWITLDGVILKKRLLLNPPKHQHTSSGRTRAT